MPFALPDQTAALRRSARNDMGMLCPAACGQVGGQLNRGDQAAWIGDALSGDVEGGAMVGRGAHDRQAKGHVLSAVHIPRLERDQRLIVIHADRDIVARSGRGDEHSVRRKGPETSIPAARSVSIAGWIRVVFPEPNAPCSPACGLRPAIASLGAAMPKSRHRAVMREAATIMSVVSMAMESRNDACTVTGTTRSIGLASIMICWPVAPGKAARNSVWPG